jgi:hypothetical protein
MFEYGYLLQDSKREFQTVLYNTSSSLNIAFAKLQVSAQEAQLG